ncbi:hypothetical protein NKI50_12645 [Mesorhizobium sp. M0563]|uniref:hypothetical protein n=1 Tax=Mesorhizobium sp. M0563 TaxID=2956959 RepID=UPI00333BD15F
MKTLIIRKFLVPLVSRAGTFIAAYLIGTIHADPVVADQFGAGLAALALVGFDLLAARFFGDKDTR